jgi:hypothetical protein
MNWKFWRKNETATAPKGVKTQRLEKPKDLPNEVGYHLVVKEGLDPDWVWRLKCVKKPRENSKNTFDIRIFSSETALLHGVQIRDYTALDNHADLIIFAGRYDKNTGSVQLEKMIKKAV